MPKPDFVMALPPGNKGPVGVRAFVTQDGACPVFPERNLQIAGVTRDSTGAALGGCSVQLFDVISDAPAGPVVVSDANGNYVIPIPKGLSQLQTTTWRLVTYKAGAPDVTGTSVNTLVGS